MTRTIRLDASINEVKASHIAIIADVDILYAVEKERDTVAPEREPVLRLDCAEAHMLDSMRRGPGTVRTGRPHYAIRHSIIEPRNDRLIIWAEGQSANQCIHVAAG